VYFVQEKFSAALPHFSLWIILQ